MDSPCNSVDNTHQKQGVPGSDVVLSESNSATLVGHESDLSEQRKSGSRFQETKKPGLVPGFFVPANFSLNSRYTPESGH